MIQSAKHAYLILAHANLYLLRKLLESIDDFRNDIFIHIDTKSNLNVEDITSNVMKSTIYVLQEKSVYWGHISLTETELLLYKTATSKGPYAYYHLLSGVDLPLKSQNFIHQFFKEHQGKEFIGFSNAIFNLDRVTKLHIFPKTQKLNQKQYFKRLQRKLRMLVIWGQNKLHYRISNKIVNFKYGSSWSSITHSLASALVDKMDEFIQFYKYSNCSDEIYKQTFVFNSHFRHSVYDYDDELKGCQRLIDWKRGEPYTFRKEDLDLLIHSDLIFARKFDENVDKEIIDLITEKVKNSVENYSQD